jgi:hypothetical protein
VGFALLDLAVKNASLSLQIRNHTSHEILRLPGRCPLLGPTKMASAKVLALGMQSERSFGGSGAPAHLYQIGYQPRDRLRKQSILWPAQLLVDREPRA